MATNQAQQLRGLALPALRTAGGYFVSKGPDDVAWGSLITSVFTPAGSRPFRRQFGSALHELVMEPADPTLQSTIETVIRDAVQRWAPGVIIRGVLTKVDRGQVGVLIQFARSDDKSRTLNTPLIYVSKSDVVNLLAASRNT